MITTQTVISRKPMTPTAVGIVEPPEDPAARWRVMAGLYEPPSVAPGARPPVLSGRTRQRKGRCWLQQVAAKLRRPAGVTGGPLVFVEVHVAVVDLRRSGEE